jgi:TRAP-type C4-dicarboxylate transport system permease small subunit
MSSLAPAGHPDRSAGSPWIHSRRFDLLFLTLSGALVFFPYVSYGLLQRLGASQGTASLAVGLAVTLLVGGPHMYSTYLRTALEPRFRQRYGWLTYLPLLLIPTLVIIGSIYSFLLLLTGFFLWASMHVTHQAQWISETYRRRAGLPVSPIDRLLDGAVILGALYTVAMYKFVEGRFQLGTSTLLFPDSLRHPWVAQAFTVGFAILFLYYVARTFREIRRGASSWPRLAFMAATVALAFIIPIFDNLDVAFQGFNTWHSLQYLALTWFILSRKAETGQIGSGFVRRISGTSHTAIFYASMIGATLLAGVVYLILWRGFDIPQDRAYYVVVLSFLLIHYFYDHILFRDFGAVEGVGARS